MGKVLGQFHFVPVSQRMTDCSCTVFLVFQYFFKKKYCENNFFNILEMIQGCIFEENLLSEWN